MGDQNQMDGSIELEFVERPAITYKQLAAMIYAVIDAPDAHDQALHDLGDVDLEALRVMCLLISPSVLESMAESDAPLWGDGAVAPDAFIVDGAQRLSLGTGFVGAVLEERAL